MNVLVLLFSMCVSGQAEPVEAPAKLEIQQACLLSDGTVAIVDDDAIRIGSGDDATVFRLLEAAADTPRLFFSGDRTHLGFRVLTETEIATELRLTDQGIVASKVMGRKLILQVIHLPTRRSLHQIEVATKGEPSFSFDGSVIGYSTVSGSLVIDTRAGKRFHIPQSGSRRVPYVHLSSDGKTCLASASSLTKRGSVLQRWDIATEKKLWEAPLEEARYGHTIFSSDGKRVISSSENGQLVVLDAANGNEICSEKVCSVTPPNLCIIDHVREREGVIVTVHREMRWSAVPKFNTPNQFDQQLYGDQFVAPEDQRFPVLRKSVIRVWRQQKDKLLIQQELELKRGIEDVRLGNGEVQYLLYYTPERGKVHSLQISP